ncbi:MAG: molybdopterin-guanine dinucleotide biosynthesis protein B [Gammaproteobacteria bacterium]|nr:molybdopterin-guanine dinucleotide biosynthesis protein B [Gammaproteobacteria bacterium]MBL6998292.1 molybdopterin-guanine dinucleotide biosynthesis protein B [Gammaproteobacteria bacterium]
MATRLPPVIGFSAYSGTGKTTLLKKIIVLLRQRDIRIAVIKHAHHDFEIDHPGKDSFELRKAGAYQMLISSARRKALITEFESFQAEPKLFELIDDLDHANIDLILVEGFKREHFAKIELHRAALNKPYLFENDQDIIALASDHNQDIQTDLQLLDLNKPEMIADFIYRLVFPA